MANGSLDAMVEESIYADLRDALLTEAQAMPEVWQKMSQQQQDELIERVDKRVLTKVQEATTLLVTHDFPAVAGTIESVTVKNKTKVVIVLNDMTPDCHDLIDAGAGASVRIVLADSAAFTVLDGSVTSDKDQPDLPLTDPESEFYQLNDSWHFKRQVAGHEEWTSDGYTSEDNARAAWKELQATEVPPWMETPATEQTEDD